MGKVASTAQQAKARARERRLALDKDRADRDAAIENHTVEVFRGLEDLAAAAEAASVAGERIGAAVRELLAIKNTTVEDVALLTELPEAEVRRYAKAATPAAVPDLYPR